MDGIKFKVHPLFIVLGVFYALTNRIAVFLIYTLSALIHELGHSLVAGNLGYSLNKITLMPFGAVVSGDIRGLKCIDQLKIALAGPLVNLATALSLVALWWIIPEIYAFTDIAAQANFALFAVNLIPVYSLDGGRVLQSLLLLKVKKRTASVVCKVTGVLLSGLLLCAFVFTLFRVPNFSLLLFSLFALFGTFGKSASENEYVRAINGASSAMIRRGAPVKRQAVDKSFTIKKLIKILDGQAVNEILVYSGEKQIATLNQEQLTKILQKGDLYSPLGNYI